MTLDVRFAETDEEREAVYRLRYEIYVDELRMFGAVADHKRRRLVDAADEVSRLVLATDDGVPVGTMRLTSGVDGPFPQELVETYSLDRFAGVVARQEMLVTTRFMVRPELRRSTAAFRLIAFATAFGVGVGTEATFCDCQPHLISLYLRLGFRPYRHTVDDPNMALMVPLVLAVRDVAYLERLRSPLLGSGIAGLEPTEATRGLLALLPERPPVRSVDLHGDHDWSAEIPGGADERSRVLRLFAGLADDELAAALEHSHVIDVPPGACLIRQGQVTETLYLPLAGELELREAGRLVATSGPGEPVGEIAFLLRRPRTLDVRAGKAGARVLSFHEPALRDLIESRSRAAAVVLLNLATLLAERSASRSGA